MSLMTRPMLAGKVTNFAKIKYPVLATPKLDGIRCLVTDRGAVTRKFKPVPNNYVRDAIEKLCPVGCDGEIVVKGENFNGVSSAVMSESGCPDFEYWVFDYLMEGKPLSTPYSVRTVDLDVKVKDSPFIVKLLPVWVDNEEELLFYENKFLKEGYEGIIIRTPDSPYKCGRSTENEGYLLKIKRFEDAEAEVIGFEEQCHNINQLEEDAFGLAKRSQCQDGLVPAGILGALIVRDLKTGCEFSIGTGFDWAQRKTLWADRGNLIGKIVKYKYQPSGMKEAPRFPVFLGFRDERDM